MGNIRLKEKGIMPMKRAIARSGVSSKQFRYWVKKGLLPIDKTIVSNSGRRFRYFNEDDFERRLPDLLKLPWPLVKFGDQDLYFIECVSLSKVKIGRSVSPKGRLIKLKNMSPLDDLVLLASFSGRGGDELRMHKQLNMRHCHGEWFSLDDSLRAWILNGADILQIPSQTSPDRF